MWPITGHDRTVAYLQRSLEKGCIAHAYLFTGSRHVGKMTLALLLAQALNCPAVNKPCGTCESCRKIAALKHPDILLIRPLEAQESEDHKAKSDIIIDQIRKIQHWANLPPYEGRCRVFILEQAQLMNEESANCLLKNIEEPLSNIVFILLCDNREALPETVVSRCQCLNLENVPAVEIERLLLSRGLEYERAKELAWIACGAPGWAINAIENEEILIERKHKLGQLLDLVTLNVEDRFLSAEKLSGQESRVKDNLQDTLRDWQLLWRDILLLKNGQSDSIRNPDFKTILASIGDVLGILEVRGFINALGEAISRAEENVNARLLVEVLMLDMPLLDKARLKR